MELQSLVQLLGHPRGPMADPVVGHPNPRRVPGDAAPIECGELGRNTPDEVLRRAVAGEEIWHGSSAVLDENVSHSRISSLTKRLKTRASHWN